jgi:hypothetical protein
MGLRWHGSDQWQHDRVAMSSINGVVPNDVGGFQVIDFCYQYR